MVALTYAYEERSTLSLKRPLRDLLPQTHQHHHRLTLITHFFIATKQSIVVHGNLCLLILLRSGPGYRVHLLTKRINHYSRRHSRPILPSLATVAQIFSPLYKPHISSYYETFSPTSYFVWTVTFHNYFSSLCASFSSLLPPPFLYFLYHASSSSMFYPFSLGLLLFLTLSYFLSWYWVHRAILWSHTGRAPLPSYKVSSWPLFLTKLCCFCNGGQWSICAFRQRYLYRCLSGVQL